MTIFTSAQIIVLGVLFFWFIINLPKFDNGVRNLVDAVRRFANTSINSIGLSKRPPSESDNLDLDVEQGDGPPLAFSPAVEVTDTEPTSHGNTSSADHPTNSHSHSLLSPSAQARVSSESSRSLPPLPQDAPVTRSMQYSPSGMFLCVGNSRLLFP